MILSLCGTHLRKHIFLLLAPLKKQEMLYDFPLMVTHAVSSGLIWQNIYSEEEGTRISIYIAQDYPCLTLWYFVGDVSKSSYRSIDKGRLGFIIYAFTSSNIILVFYCLSSSSSASVDFINVPNLWKSWNDKPLILLGRGWTIFFQTLSMMRFNQIMWRTFRLIIFCSSSVRERYFLRWWDGWLHHEWYS